MAFIDRELEPFRDEEDEVMTLLAARFGTEENPLLIGDTTPDSFDEEKANPFLPFVRVGRVGGSPRAGDEHTDRPNVDVDVFAATRGEAKDLAQRIEQFLMSKPHPIDRCVVLMSPQRVEWVEGSPIRRFYASYQLALRR